MAGTLGIATLETQVDTKGLDKGLQDSKKKTEGFLSTAKKGFAQQFGFSAADAAMSAARAVKQFADESIAEFQDFERGMSEVFTLLPNASEQATESMKADVLDFSREAGRTTDEVIPALYQAISAGIPAENVFDFMQIASDAALGGVTDLETAVDGITSVVNAYGEEMVNAQQASDVMFTAVKLGKTDFEQLSGALFNVIPTAASLGVSFGDVAANLAAMTAQGVPTSVATTQLRQAFVEASKSGTKLDQAIRDLTGKGFGDLIKEGKTSSQIFSILRDSMPEQEFKDLFGSVEASNAALLITSDTADGIIDSFGTMEDTMGATADAAAEMADTMEHLEARAEAATEAFKIQQGEALSPLKRDFLNLKIALFDADVAWRAVDDAQRAGTISAAEANRELAKLTFTGYDAADVMAFLDKRMTDFGSSSRGTADEIAQGTRELEELTAATLEAMTATEEQTEAIGGLSAEQEFLIANARDLRQSNEEVVITADMVKEAEERRAQATEDAAEASRLAAEAAAEHAAKLGGYFNAALTATEQTDSLELQLYEAGTAAGLGAEDLLVLATATGEFTQAELDAAFQAAMMRENIDQLVTAVQNGRISAEEATTALDLLKQGEEDTAEGAIGLIESTRNVNEHMNAARDAAMQFDDALDGLDGRQIKVDVLTTYREQGNKPTTPGAGGQSSQGGGETGGGDFQVGGWTGSGPSTEVAGSVHRNELVTPAPVLNAGPAAILDFAQRNVPGGVGSGGPTAVTLDLRGAFIGSQQEFDRMVDAAFTQRGVNANTIRRTR